MVLTLFIQSSLLALGAEQLAITLLSLPMPPVGLGVVLALSLANTVVLVNATSIMIIFFMLNPPKN
jgi:hypothetical protein